MLTLGLLCIGAACLAAFTPMWTVAGILAGIYWNWLKYRTRSAVRRARNLVRDLLWTREAVRVGEWRMARADLFTRADEVTVTDRQSVMALAGPAGNFFGLEYTPRMARTLHRGESDDSPVVICTPYRHLEVGADEILPDLRTFFPSDDTSE